MSREQLLEAVQFRYVDVRSPAVGGWCRVDHAEFCIWLKTACPDNRVFKAEVIGLVVRIG